MKMMLLSQKDVEAINGHWVLEVNANDPDYTITESNWNFVSEKRLFLYRGTASQVCTMIMVAIILGKSLLSNSTIITKGIKKMLDSTDY